VDAFPAVRDKWWCGEYRHDAGKVVRRDNSR